jgi:hypothetical protein
MKFTQFYCSSEEGMRLRSGKIINCINNSELAQSAEKLKNKIIFYYGEQCGSIFKMLEFVEKYYHVLKNNKNVVPLYYSIGKNVEKIMLAIENSHNICKCNLISSRWHTLLWCEHEHLDKIYKSIDFPDIENYVAYEERTKYRLHNKNFIEVKRNGNAFHNITRIKNELTHWHRYFNRAHQSEINWIYNYLSNNVTNSDCASIIVNFL